MALVKYGSIVADARGAVGGEVYSRNSAGAYVRNKTKPIYPASEKQVAMAALMSTVVSDWQLALTTAQRTLWNNLAAVSEFRNRLGDEFHPSGFNIFVLSNILLDLTAQAHVTAPPISASAPAPTLTLAWTTLVGVECTDIGNWDNSACSRLLAQKSPDLKQTINFYKQPWTLTWGQNGAYYDILPALITPSAQLVADTRVYYSFRAVHADGAVSHPAVYFADVGAVP